MTSATNLPVPIVRAGTPSRRYDLDWLRVFAFGMLIFYHVGMFYVTWGWHVKSPSASPALEPAMSLVNPWRLALLFFISGVAIRFAIDKTTLAKFLPNRFMRLFVPVVFGMAVVVMPQAYAELVTKGEIAPGILDFWPTYLAFGDFSIMVPTWNHLWYVMYVLVYTLALVPFSGLLRWLAEGPAETAFAWMARRPWSVLLLPALPFLAYRLFLDPIFPTTHALTDDWANHAHSFTILVLGFVAAKSPAFWRGIDKALPLALTAAIACGTILLAARLNWETVMASEALTMAVRLGRIFYAWAVIVSLLGLGQRYFNRPGRALSYLTEAIFPYYILHQTLIVVIGFWLIPYALPAGIEVAVVVGVTLLGCALGYEIVRRIPPLRPLFGLPLREKVGAAKRLGGTAVAAFPG